MTETEKKYDAIRRAYPETISKDQFYRIAHISKATALHLLQNGLVPCKDTGKKTRRYTIRTDDVIAYLIDREIHPEKYGAPDHWYRDRSGYRRSRNTFRYELSSLSEIEKKLFEEYTRAELASYGDLLSVEETMEITGYSSTAIYRWCNAKKLVGFKISGKFIIPKIGLAEFLISPYSFDIGQSVVADAAGVIHGTTNIDIASTLDTMRTSMEAMGVGELLGLAIETLVISLCLKIMSILITVILYGRMIEIYCTVSIAPIPIATMSNREWGSIGTNYLKGLFALAFQGFLIMICVGIYAVLINNMIIAANIHSALFSVAAYTVILCFSLFKTGSLSKSLFNAH